MRDIDDRFKEHLRHRGDYKFHRAIRKYGEKNFSIEEVMYVEAPTKEELKAKLDFLEKYFIQRYDTRRNGYNSTDGGDGILMPRTEEWKRKISISLMGHSSTLKGKHLPEESKRLMSERMKGKKLSEQAKLKISKANKGKHVSEEVKQRLKEMNSGENNPFYNKRHTDKVKQIMSEKKIGSKGYWLGKKRSEETKRKISESLKGNIPWNKKV